MQRRTKRKNANDYPDVTISDEEDAPISVPHRHEITQPSAAADGSYSTQTSFFNLMSSPRRLNTGALTLPNLYSPGATVRLNDNNIIDYATSGNFEHEDFGMDLLYLDNDAEDTVDEGRAINGKRIRLSKADGVGCIYPKSIHIHIYVHLTLGLASTSKMGRKPSRDLHCWNSADGRPGRVPRR